MPAPATEPAAGAFLDSNVVLYLLSADDAKADAAEALLRQRPVISVQVLNEVTLVCRRKLGMPWEEIQDFLAMVRSLCTVVPLTQTIHDNARRLAQQYGLAFYDACIAAAALDAGCVTLYSEDMHHGLVLDKATAVRNPFVR
nr:PIN domain-containing protein [Variovorax boronicumulans]